jgi:hypothetical protein
MSNKESMPRTSRTRSPLLAPPASSSPVPPPTQVPWGGHYPATRLALEGILKRSITGNGRVRSHEQALIYVCELRRAVVNGEWLERLPRNCLKELGYARLALKAIGAASVAAYLSETMTALRRFPQREKALLLKLERDLIASGPTLDVWTARYAQSLLDGNCGIDGSVDASRKR